MLRNWPRAALPSGPAVGGGSVADSVWVRVLDGWVVETIASGGEFEMPADRARRYAAAGHVEIIADPRTPEPEPTRTVKVRALAHGDGLIRGEVAFIGEARAHELIEAGAVEMVAG
jgi:hypothetical protein